MSNILRFPAGKSGKDLTFEELVDDIREELARENLEAVDGLIMIYFKESKKDGQQGVLLRLMKQKSIAEIVGEFEIAKLSVLMDGGHDE
jgi:hypothetical protein